MRFISVCSLSLLWFAAGCGGEPNGDCAGDQPAETCPDAGPEQPVNACPGDAPALSACFEGEFFAECGGDGAPTFACAADGDCRWFTDGCVAQTYIASPCPAEDVCCLNNYPYPELDEPVDLLDVLPALYSHGQEPWDRDRAMDVTVAVDGDLVPAADPTLLCTRDGVPVDEGPCSPEGALPLFAGNNMVDTLFGLAGRSGLGGELLSWEVDVSAAGGPRARVCVMPFTDGFPAECQPSPPVRCADAGLVTLSRLPAADEAVDDVALTIDVEIDGLRLELAM